MMPDPEDSERPPLKPTYAEIEYELASTREQLRKARAVQDIVMAGIIARAELELSGLRAPCACDRCGHAHEKLVAQVADDGR